MRIVETVGLAISSVQAIVDEHRQEEEEQQPGDAALPLTPLTAAANSILQQPHSQQANNTGAAALALAPGAACASAVTPAPAEPPAFTPAATALPQAATAAAAAAAAAVAGTPAAGAAAVAGTPGVTPAPVSLLKLTQPANLLTSSPLSATPASRRPGNASTHSPIASDAVMPDQARPPASAGVPPVSQATQNTEVC